VPSPQSTRMMSSSTWVAMPLTLRRLLGLPLEVPSQVTDRWSMGLGWKNLDGIDGAKVWYKRSSKLWFPVTVVLIVVVVVGERVVGVVLVGVVLVGMLGSALLLVATPLFSCSSSLLFTKVGV